MKINKQNLKNDTPIFDDLQEGAIFIGTPIDSAHEGVFMKIDANSDFVCTDIYEEAGLAVDLEDGSLVAFRFCAGIRKVDGSLTLS